MQDIWQKNNIKWSPKIHNVYFFYLLFLPSFKNSVFTQTTTKTFFVVKKLCLGVIKYVNWPQEFFCVRKFLLILVNILNNVTRICLHQIFEWWYFRKYGTSFIEHVSLSHLGPLLGSSDSTPQNTQQNVAGALYKTCNMLTNFEWEFNLCLCLAWKAYLFYTCIR